MCVSQIFRAHLLNNTEFIKINSRTQSTHYWLTGIEARLPFIRPQIWFVVRWWISTNRSAAWNTRGFRMQRRKVLSLVFDARFWWLIAAKRRRCQYWKKIFETTENQVGMKFISFVRDELLIDHPMSNRRYFRNWSVDSWLCDKVFIIKNFLLQFRCTKCNTCLYLLYVYIWTF